MQVKGFEAPSEEDIAEFGLYYACQRSNGEFSLYDDGAFAARGRIGLSPLYWNREFGIFSFKPGKDLDEFPPGYLYNVEYDRLICWESVYFDKPMNTLPCAVRDVRLLLNKAVNRYRYDAFIVSSGCGSRTISEFIYNDAIPTYTVGTRHCYDIENSYGDDIYCSSSDNPMKVLAQNMANNGYKRVICGLGCFELFKDSTNFHPTINHVIDEFAKHEIELWSPFFDISLVEYVLDKTLPEDREKIMYSIIDEDELFDGMEINDTTGTVEKKKSWYTSINEIVQRWYV
jgi:hypothetical protein